MFSSLEALLEEGALEQQPKEGQNTKEQKVWFVREGGRLNWYTCFNSLGNVQLKIHFKDTVVCTLEHELKTDQSFAGWISYVDQWVKGTSFQWDVPLENLPLPTQTLASVIAAGPAAADAGMTALAAGNALLSGAVLTTETNVPLAPQSLAVTLGEPVTDISELGSLAAVRVLPLETLNLQPAPDPGGVYWLANGVLRPLAQTSLETLLPQAGSVTLAAVPQAQASGGNQNAGAGNNPPPSNIPADDLDNHTRVALIPIFLVISQVEGMEAVVKGALDGFKSGVEDDYQMLLLLKKGVVVAGDLAAKGIAEIESWKTDRIKRAATILVLTAHISEEFVFKPLRSLHEDLSTWEGFKRRAFQLYELHNKVIDFHRQAFVVAKDNAPKLVDAMTSWMDDFSNRMLVQSEHTAFAKAFWNKDTLVGGFMEQNRHVCYTFGHTFGYIVEQVLSGVVQAGAGKVATVLVKGGARLAGNVLKRNAAALAARAHWLKHLLAESGMADALLRAAYERGMVKCAVEPVGPTIKEAIFEVLEKAFSREGFERSIYSWKHLQDDILQRPNLSRLIKQQGGEVVFQRRLSQLATILGDEFDAMAAKNFAKLADEIILVPRADGTVDEFFEAFFRAFTGNPSELAHADAQFTSKIALPADGKAALKTFLSDPSPGKLWDTFDETTFFNNRARGVLAELSIYKRYYKGRGYSHHPNAPGFDLTGPAWVQIKTVKNPEDAYQAMRTAVNKLVAETPAGKPLELHILVKEENAATNQLKAQVQAYINNNLSSDARDRFLPVKLEAFELSP